MEDYEHTIKTKQTKKGTVTKLVAKEGYGLGVYTLAKVLDNGNGYTVKFPSYSSVEPDVYMNIGYAESEYLRLVFNHIEEVS